MSPFIGLKFAGNAQPIFADLEDGASNTKMTLGVSVAVLSDNIFGLEGEFGHTPRFFEQSGGEAVVSTPTWSPDGQRIAFGVFNSVLPQYDGIWSMNVDGSGLSRCAST